MSKRDEYPWEGLEELARLLEFGRVTTEVTRFGSDLLPVLPSAGATIADFGCGPGSWTCAAASKYPQFFFLGIDSDPNLIDYATAQSIKLGLTNVQFLHGSFRERKPGDPEKLKRIPVLSEILSGPVDVIYARIVSWFLSDYAATVGGWKQWLNPGGTLILLEGESQITNSKAFNTFAREMALHFHRTNPNLVGNEISPVMGVTLQLWPALLKAGFINIQSQAFAQIFSSDFPGRESYVANFQHGLANVINMLCRELPAPEAKQRRQALQQLAEEWKQDLLFNPEFQGIEYLLCMWGQKL